MKKVEVYGADHSPWVQAVLLGLHEAKIPCHVRSLPPLETFKTSGVMMPAARIDDGAWQLESADILQSLGFSAVSSEDMQMVRRTWNGVMHRADSTPLFWGGFSFLGSSAPTPARRAVDNFFRSFITLYMYLLIRTVVLSGRIPDPRDYADQYLPLEERLKSGAPFLSGEKPDSLDFLAFGIVQCHCSIPVPPLHALQMDPRLERVRTWIGTMQEHFKGYDRLYSGLYFEPHSTPPARPGRLERTAFWLGSLSMIAAFPVTVPLVAFLAMRVRRG